MNKDDIAYAAGLFDAEGSVSIGKWKRKTLISPSHYLRVSLSSANHKILDWLKNNFNGCISIANKKNSKISLKYKGKTYRSKHTVFRWRTTSNAAVDFLQRIAPYLQIKRPQAELALQFQNEIKQNAGYNQVTQESLQHREQFKNQIYFLNHEHSSIGFLNKCKIAYVAGLFDGDGFVCIFIKPGLLKYGYHSISAGISSTNYLPIFWLKKNFGGCIQINRSGVHSIFIWHIVGSKITRNFFQQISPHLRIKKIHAELAFQFCKEKERNVCGQQITLKCFERREQFRKRMKILNH